MPRPRAGQRVDPWISGVPVTQRPPDRAPGTAPRAEQQLRFRACRRISRNGAVKVGPFPRRQTHLMITARLPALRDTVGIDMPRRYRPRGVCAYVTPVGG